MTGKIDDGQRKAARVVGLAYLLALVPAIFSEFYVRGSLISDSAARTALGIVAHERLFRLGIASNLAVFAIDIALITALYLVLKPVGRGVALAAAAWGVIETGILVTATLSDLDVLRLLGGAENLRAFGADRLQALAMVSVGAHGAAYNVGLVFSGLRGTAFCSLWLRSGYIPKALALWGVLASVLMGACALSFIIAPELVSLVPVAVYGGPIFFFELVMGFWLLLRGLRP
ncbi:MAG: DUF4386 domain-containing protein [Hyphomicrobiales bacterium]